MFSLSLSSISYFVFVLAFVFVYYLMPRRMQWKVLLLASALFFYIVSGAASVIWLLVSALTTYGFALIIEKTQKEKARKIFIIAAIVCVIGELYLLKYTKGLPLVAPIAISFYSLSILGYVLDVYWGISSAEKNPFLHLLYTCYFPQMTSGPITRYRDLKPQFIQGAAFNEQKVKGGIIRIVYGIMKKCIIADQAAVVVNTIFGDTITYQGAYVLLGAMMFSLQLYTDFSGCMDIVLGTSECFGITLPENFDIPFSSTTMSEFWRRWHITLGVWFKEYVMYPLQKSAPFQKLTSLCVEKWGRKKGKKPPTYLGLLIVWFLIGYWHGGALHYVIGSGLLHWFYIVSGEHLEPHIKNLTEKLSVDRNSKGYVLARRIKVYLLVISGFVFFRSGTTYQAVKMLYRMIHPVEGNFFTNFSVFDLGMSGLDFAVMFAGCVVLWTVSHMKARQIGVREWLGRQKFIIRYGIYFLISILAILGITRNFGADVSYFIYNQF